MAGVAKRDAFGPPGVLYRHQIGGIMSNPFAILDPKPATSDSEKPKYEPKTTSLRTREGGRKIVFPEDWQRLNRENEALKKSRFDTGRYNFPTIEIHGSQQGGFSRKTFVALYPKVCSSEGQNREETYFGCEVWADCPKPF